MDYPKSDPGSRLNNDKFTDGDSSQGIPASVDKAAHMNAVYDELIAVITGLGLSPDESDPEQLMAAINIAAPWSQITFHYVDVYATDPVPGWRICDGNNGTPALLYRYLRMGPAGDAGGQSWATTLNGYMEVDDTTLSESQGAVHTHGLDGQLVGGSGDSEGSSGRFVSGGSQDTSNTRILDSAGGDEHNHTGRVRLEPSYYTLAPFMRADYADYLLANGGL